MAGIRANGERVLSYLRDQYEVLRGEGGLTEPPKNLKDLSGYLSGFGLSVQRDGSVIVVEAANLAALSNLHVQAAIFYARIS